MRAALTSGGRGMQEWQLQALDALAVWLQEDSQRVTPKLLVRRNVAIIVDVFRPSSKSQERLLRPLRDILNGSPKLAAHCASQVRISLCSRQNALACGLATTAS
jgi:hypothetical protein